MKKLVKEDLQDLKFDGIIVGVPIIENIKEGQHDDISFIVECSYYTNGKHGYPEPGSGCDNSSFYHVAYNMNCLHNGLWMNATSRFTIDHTFRFDTYDYYKFDNMEEFCKWYLERKQNNTLKPVKGKEGLVWNGTNYIKPSKSTRSERLKEVQEYVQKVMNISDIKRLYEQTNSVGTAQMLKEAQQELLDWLKEEV